MTDEYDYRLDGPNAELIEVIPETKFFVAESSLTIDAAEKLFKQEKTSVFKGFFKRPKADEVVVKEIKKSYEPYVIIGGKYELRYLTERTYDIDLLDDTVSVFILGEELIVPEKPQEEEETEVEIKSSKKKGFFEGLFSTEKTVKKSKPEIQLKGIEHVHVLKEIMEARNYSGQEVNPDSLPTVELKPVSKQFLDTEGKMVPTKYYDIDKLLSEVIKEYTTKPEHLQRVLFEKLEITDKKVIFYPVFWTEMVYKGKETKHVRLDAITKKVEAQKGSRYAPPPSTDSVTELPPTTTAGHCPGCGEPTDPEDKFCNNCGLKLK